MMIDKGKTMDQTNPIGFYAGKRISDRYQVLESTITRGSYFVYDHSFDDNMRNKDGSTMYFTSITSAEAYIKGKRK